MRIKICGVNSDEAFDTAVDAGADWVGFIFFPRSPRVVSPAEAASLSARHGGGPKRVGLFVTPTEAEIEAALSAVRLDVLQLYVDAPRAAALRTRFGLPIWRAVGTTQTGDLPDTATGADGFVIEPKPPP
jgi:phosphoribosylanthranilate isomerase